MKAEPTTRPCLKCGKPSTRDDSCKVCARAYYTAWSAVVEAALLAVLETSE